MLFRQFGRTGGSTGVFQFEGEECNLEIYSSRLLQLHGKNWHPWELALDWDNVGLQIGEPPDRFPQRW